MGQTAPTFAPMLMEDGMTICSHCLNVQLELKVYALLNFEFLAKFFVSFAYSFVFQRTGLAKHWRYVNYYLAPQVERAFENGLDVADPLVLAEIALIDLVLKVEDSSGDSLRVAVRVTTDERRA